MTTDVTCEFEIEHPREQVWEFISDHGNRAEAISVVADYEVDSEDDSRATWHVELPIPLVRKTVEVQTEEVKCEPPDTVEFTGDSAAMQIRGRHQLVETDQGCRMINNFTVDGRIPGVEKYFEGQLEDELHNLGDAFRDHVEN